VELALSCVRDHSVGLDPSGPIDVDDFLSIFGQKVLPYARTNLNDC
jgi:hypothetical protein